MTNHPLAPVHQGKFHQVTTALKEPSCGFAYCFALTQGFLMGDLLRVLRWCYIRKVNMGVL